MQDSLSNYLLLAALPILLIISACANTGKLSSVPRNETEALLADLQSQSDRYVIHYYGNSEKFVSGILFDPKDDGNRIKPEGLRWEEVRDSEAIASIIRTIRQSNHPSYFPRVYEINDPLGTFYGYLFTGWSYLVIRPVDEHTLKVYGLKGPPEYEDIYPGGR